jgi:hypothetical protein
MVASSEALSEPLAPDLQEYHRETQHIKRDAEDLFQGLSDAEANWCPSPGGWSIVQCIDHLNRVGKLYLRPIDGAIKTARANGWRSERPARRGLIGNLLIRSMEPPPRIRMPTSSVIAPRAEQPFEPVATDFLVLQDKLMERLHAADGLDLGRALVVSPVSSLLKLNLSAAIGFLLAHERRHLWQAWRVRARPEFPAG